MSKSTEPLEREHDRQCPIHEDFEHDCFAPEKRPDWAYPVLPIGEDDDLLTWGLRVTTQLRLPMYVRIDFCPYCGEELEPIRCQCEQIKKAKALGVYAHES